MTVQIYKSTDASAPSLSGTVGSLITLLDACLVNGYGAKAAAGWTKPYTGTNKAVFRNSTTTGTGFYLNVNDAAPLTAKEAQVRGFEVMTAQDTGTNPFPLTAQLLSGIYIRKSTTADATAREWIIIADETVFYLFTKTGDFTTESNKDAFNSFWFGDIYSYKTADAYACGIAGRQTENSTSNYEYFGTLNAPVNSSGIGGTFTTLTAHYIARVPSGVGGSALIGKSVNGFNSSGIGYPYTTHTNGLIYPNTADNGLYLGNILITEQGAVRGYLKGLWCPLAAQPLNHGDTFTAGSKSFLVVAVLSVGASASGRMVLEISDTWS